MGEEVRKRCKKCLLRDIDKNEYFKTLKQAIDAIAADERTEEAVYEERLGLCSECEKLIEGMCAVCGCFVELRAAKKSVYFPAVNAKW